MIGTRPTTDGGLFRKLDHPLINGRSTRISSSETEPLLLRVARGEGNKTSLQILTLSCPRCRTDPCLAHASSRSLYGRLPQVNQKSKNSVNCLSRFSDKYPFRMRSETPSIAIELSLQPYRSFNTDGVIMFSDILTPLPALGVEFDLIKGKGPVILNPIRRSTP